MKPHVEEGLVGGKARNGRPVGRLLQQPRDVKVLVLKRAGSHSQTSVSLGACQTQIPGPTPKVLTQQVYGSPAICNLNQVSRGRWSRHHILQKLRD